MKVCLMLNEGQTNANTKCEPILTRITSMIILSLAVEREVLHKGT